MAKNFTVCMGTLGAGLWRSPDGGERWQRSRLGDGYKGDKSIYDLAVDPKDASIMYAAAADGVYRSRDRGASFEHLDLPSPGRVWRVLVDPVNPDTVFAGTCPAAVFRSRDAGERWERVCTDFADECMNVGTPRITALAIDPANHRTIWAGAEVDGVRLSLDGGDTWTRVTGGLMDEPDIHDIAVVPSSPTRVLVATPQEICVSDDAGDSWQGVGARDRFSMPYCRSVAIKSDDPSVLFVGTGNGALGDGGAIQRSADGGKTWEAPRLPAPANSYIARFATHAADPNLVLACSHNGQLFASSDGGDWWIKIPKEGTEIRTALAWFPN